MSQNVPIAVSIGSRLDRAGSLAALRCPCTTNPIGTQSVHFSQRLQRFLVESFYYGAFTRPFARCQNASPFSWLSALSLTSCASHPSSLPICGGLLARGIQRLNTMLRAMSRSRITIFLNLIAAKKSSVNCPARGSLVRRSVRRCSRKLLFKAGHHSSLRTNALTLKPAPTAPVCQSVGEGSRDLAVLQPATCFVWGAGIGLLNLASGFAAFFAVRLIAWAIAWVISGFSETKQKS